MKPSVLWILFIGWLGVATLVPAQTPTGASKVVRRPVVKEERELTFEAAAEKLIRAAYAKLTRYNRASLLVDSRRDMSLPAQEAYLRFKLSNFKAGPIQEILNLPHSEVRTNTPEEIDLARGVVTLNNADPHVAYSTRWSIVQYASGYDPKWTINDLLSHEPATYHNVGAYATYDVVLQLNGKVRSYRALTLFHNPYGSVENLEPTFWDPMVGSAGALKGLWYEQRPPVGESPQSEPNPP
ncbi:MAG TPA: hypothetical protein VJS64_08425, partial [Pyrinomonadaceae bacterium]|nr:hypothetical protein [Pyrinomonadaceae bacterium]